MRQIDDDALTLADVPEPDADWNVITDFALTFDGYKYWGSFEKCAEIANAGRQDCLTDLRTCLFFAQRSWRHFGEEPDAEAMKYIRGLVQKIREWVGSPADSEAIIRVLSEAKKLAQEYRRLTGKPLGITGEVAEYEAARILGVKLTAARQAGYDAIETRNGIERRLQIKGRCVLNRRNPGQPLGSIKVDREWNAVLMVLLDENFDAVEIYEAERALVVAALTAPGSKARNERGAMAVSKFKSIGTLRWRRPATPDGA